MPNSPTATAAPRHRAALRRLLSAQESGLLLVILAMLLGLSLATPTITKRDRVFIPAEAAFTAEPSAFSVTQDGVQTRYLTADGWTVSELRTGARWLERSYEVNKFFNKENLVGLAKDASFIAVMAVGMAGIIILGGIDLSIGSIYALAAVIGAMALQSLSTAADSAEVAAIVSIPSGLLVCCGIGALCGAANGIATVGLRVHPFIITLGGMAVFRGIAFVITKGQSISDFPASFTTHGFKASLWGVNPVPMFIMVAVALAGAFVLQRTVFGRRSYAVGGNETAARYAGIPVGSVKIAWFTIAGILAGLSAAMMLGYYGSASSDAGGGYELRVIAAAVVGGASLSGGRGSAIGAMLGAVVIQLIENGIVVLNIDSNYTNIVIGLAIIIAVVIDQAKHRLAGRARA